MQPALRIRLRNYQLAIFLRKLLSNIFYNVYKATVFTSSHLPKDSSLVLHNGFTEADQIMDVIGAQPSKFGNSPLPECPL